MKRWTSGKGFDRQKKGNPKPAVKKTKELMKNNLLKIKNLPTLIKITRYSKEKKEIF